MSISSVTPRPFASLKAEEVQPNKPAPAVSFNREKQIAENNATFGTNIDYQKEKSAEGAKLVLNLLV